MEVERQDTREQAMNAGNIYSLLSIRQPRPQLQASGAECAEGERKSAFPGAQVFTLDTASGELTPGGEVDAVGHGIHLLA
jgi:hypothetical protein